MACALKHFPGYGNNVDTHTGMAQDHRPDVYKRQGVLTKNLAKPAVPYGGKYRIIDFPLSNCVNSGIESVGVLTQYQPCLLYTSPR